MHEEGIVGESHFLGVDSPGTVGGEHFAIVGVSVGRPVFGIDEIGAFESLELVVLHAGLAHELGSELVAMRVGDDEVVVRSVHPLGKRVGHGLGQCLGVGSPAEHNLGALHSLVLLDGDEVGEALQGVAGGSLHGEHGAAGVADELVDYPLLVVLSLVLKTGE